MQPETLIIGAGVIGLSIARELHKRGEHDLLLLDCGTAGSEASWAAAGMLSPQAESSAQDDFFRFCCEARDLYPDFAEDLIQETGIDVELDRTGTLSTTFSEHESAELEKRFNWQTQAGLRIEKLTATEIRELEPELHPAVQGGLLLVDDWQVENRKLIQALIEYTRRNRIQIRDHVEVRKVLVDDGRVRGVETSSGIVSCGRVILTAGAWTPMIEPVTVPVKPIRGQMIAFMPERSLVRHVIYGLNGYLVPRRDGRILAGATVEDVGFDKTVTDVAVNSLQNTALEIVPALGNLNISDTWSGLRPFALDGLPVLGSISGIEHLTVATGHYRNGILLAPITGRLIADHLNGNDSEYLRIFGADRFVSRSWDGI